MTYLHSSKVLIFNGVSSRIVNVKMYKKHRRDAAAHRAWMAIKLWVSLWSVLLIVYLPHLAQAHA